MVSPRGRLVAICVAVGGMLTDDTIVRVTPASNRDGYKGFQYRVAICLLATSPGRQDWLVKVEIYDVVLTTRIVIFFYINRLNKL